MVTLDRGLLSHFKLPTSTHISLVTRPLLSLPLSHLQLNIPLLALPSLVATMSDEIAIMNGLQQHTPEGTQSPLFEPECPDSSAAIAAISPSSSPKSRQSSSPESSAVSPHIAQLQTIESATKAAIASWNHSVLSILPAKRKGMQTYRGICEG